MKRAIHKEISAAEERSEPFWVVTVIATGGSAPATPGMKMLVHDDGSTSGTVGGGEIEKKVADRILRERPRQIQKWTYDMAGVAGGEKTAMECGGMQEMLVEPGGPAARLFIVGGGHCGMALCRLASQVGFSVTVIDDRPEWASKERHPDAARVIRSDYDRVLEHVLSGHDSYVVIMTHEHVHDEKALRLLLDHDYRYLGMIGSRRKVRLVLERLAAGGGDRERLRQVFAPVGFAIGSHTPEEIAVSILAQLIAVRSGMAGIRFNENPLLET